jgi:hypothetical protein
MASIQSRGVSPREMPRSNRSTSFGISENERLVEEFEARDLGVVQVDHDAGALGGVDARLAQRILQPLRLIGLYGPCRLGRLPLPSPHSDKLAAAMPAARQSHQPRQFGAGV